MPSNEKTQVDYIAIKVNGTDLSQVQMDALREAEISTSLGLPAMFILRFHDETLALIDSGPFVMGAAVQIDIANRGTNQFTTIMKGEITAIEPEFTEDMTARIIVRGYDKSHRLNRGTKTRVFVNATDSDIVKKVASQAGLSATTGATTTVHPHVFQHNQSDLTFVYALAHRNGFEVLIDDTALYFRKPQGGQGELSLEWGVGLRSFRPRFSLAKQVDEVIVKGWDPKTKAEIVGQATSSQSAPSIGMQGWGGSLAKTAFASSARRVEVHQAVTSQSEADSIAKALLDEINAGFVEADGVAFGNPQLAAGKKVKLTKLGTKFSGTYLVTSATHLYSPDGFETHFTVEGARQHLLMDLVGDSSASDDVTAYWGGVVPAIVTNNNSSEEDWGKVKVKFPWLDSALESNWARVASVGAGAERGLYWLPEVNDEVLVAFEHGDFNRPYVVGSLWNGKDKPPEPVGTGVKSGKVETRTLKTRAGHIIRLTDESGSEKIEIIDAKQKTQITLDTANEKITINSTKEVEIKGATNQIFIDKSNKITIKATSDINIESTTGNLTIKGMNVKVEATANLELKSNATGKLESIGPLTVKGAMVSIN